MSKEKELDFFIEGKNWQEGPRWYDRELRGFRRSLSPFDRPAWLGEASPTARSFMPWSPASSWTSSRRR